MNTEMIKHPVRTAGSPVRDLYIYIPRKIYIDTNTHADRAFTSPITGNRHRLYGTLELRDLTRYVHTHDTHCTLLKL